MVGHPAYARAIRELKESGELGRRCRCRTSPYLNNIIERDHRFIKKRIVASLGFRSAEGAWRTIEATRQCMRFAKDRSAGWQRVSCWWANVNSSMRWSASLHNTGLKRIADQVRVLPFATDPTRGSDSERPHLWCPVMMIDINCVEPTVLAPQHSPFELFQAQPTNTPSNLANSQLTHFRTPQPGTSAVPTRLLIWVKALCSAARWSVAYRCRNRSPWETACDAFEDQNIGHDIAIDHPYLVRVLHRSARLCA